MTHQENPYITDRSEMAEFLPQGPDKEPHSLLEYMLDPRVSSTALQFLGGTGSLWSDMSTVSSEFISVGTIEKAFSAKRSPLSAIPPTEVEEKIRTHGGRVELYSSLLQKDSENFPGVPKRVVLHWDIDKFIMRPDNNYDEQKPIENPWETFMDLESTHQTVGDYFNVYGIKTLDVMSGKGLHLYTQVSDPAVIRLIEDIGGPIEPTVQDKLATVHLTTKRPTPIPLFHEQAFKGATRLQQYVICQTIRQARELANCDIEIWDKNQPGRGREGIALDNTAALLMCHTKPTGMPGSPYYIKPARSGVKNERIRLQLPLKGEGYANPWHDVLNESYSYRKSADYLAAINSTIPDASSPIEQLIADYLQSDLRRLHEAMDSSFGDDPATFAWGYRRNNYEGIIRQTKAPHYIRHVIRYANPILVQLRNEVDRFVFQVFEAMGGSRENLSPAPHVAGLLRSIYEDPMKNWGDQWMRNVDALRFARGSVEMVLGQLFEN